MSNHFLFENPLAFRLYAKGEVPSADMVCLGMFVEDWRDNPYVPDHFLKNRRDFVLGSSGCNSAITLGEIILHVLAHLNSRYLVWEHDRLFVREELYGEWQDLLANISPLLLMAFSVYKHVGPLPSYLPHQNAYIDRWLLPNFHYTALPYPANPLLEGLIRREGLIEIHCHLNGSTESDSVWLDAVSRPLTLYQNISKIWGMGSPVGECVREQFEQIESGLTPVRIWQRLDSVRELRAHVCNRLFTQNALEEPEHAKLSLDSFKQITGRFTSSRYQWNSPDHPAAAHLWPSERHGKLVLEAAFLTRLFQRLDSQADDALAHALYFHLLTNAQFIKLLVQQVKQFGFAQFQKITLNEARAISEKEYKRRFYQLDATTAGDIRYLEGRFAPKSSMVDVRKLLTRVEEEFKKFKDECPAKRMELGLVCHFIKRAEDVSPAGCRHHRLRSDLMKFARSLTQACRSLTDSRKPQRVVGVDAASNELQTPPEVFAPVYRHLHRGGMHQFTYHVGEDFIHLLSGIRAVHEAVVFLNLCSGDRIGHGTAVGIEPELWQARVGNVVYMPQGDYLDDLVFAYHRLMQIPGFHHVTAQLADKIAELSEKVYGEVYSPQVLHKAWSFRQIDPMIAFNPARQRHILDRREREEELGWVKKMSKHSETEYLYRYYHGYVVSWPELKKRWYELLEVRADFLPMEALRRLQEEQLSELVERSIAIESMPISNLRIGYYHDLAEHHIFRWLGITCSDSVRPLVCIGSDDPGIFATSIRAEYLHIYRVLVRDYRKTPTEAIYILEGLLKNANAFRFSSPAMALAGVREDSV